MCSESAKFFSSFVACVFIGLKRQSVIFVLILSWLLQVIEMKIFLLDTKCFMLSQSVRLSFSYSNFSLCGIFTFFIFLLQYYYIDFDNCDNVAFNHFGNASFRADLLQKLSLQNAHPGKFEKIKYISSKVLNTHAQIKEKQACVKLLSNSKKVFYNNLNMKRKIQNIFTKITELALLRETSL